MIGDHPIVKQPWMFLFFIESVDTVGTFLYPRRESNPQAFATASKTAVSTSSTTRAIIAEDVGFEPTDLLRSTVFKTAAIDHSANLP